MSKSASATHGIYTMEEKCGMLASPSTSSHPFSPFSHSCCLGILHKGNGENQFISQQPPVIGSIMGNGRRRSISCPSCNGLADGNKLLAPVALTCGSDGSLYVGDFNYIRRIFPSGNVTNILELRYIRLPKGFISDYQPCDLLVGWIDK